jgi:hypothetical protein
MTVLGISVYQNSYMSDGIIGTPAVATWLFQRAHPRYKLDAESLISAAEQVRVFVVISRLRFVIFQTQDVSSK